MELLFLILIFIASVILGFIVLIQNPKGGGLASNVGGGIGNQLMGVKQTTDVLEKGTWIFASVIAILCICSTLFIKAPQKGKGLLNELNTKPNAAAPAPANATPVTPTPGQQPAPAPQGPAK